MNASDQPILNLQQVCKRYQQKTVLNDLSFSVSPGELIALLGVNGAGKSTTINIMLGLEKADSGEISICGAEPGSLAARQQVGVTAQDTDFPEGLSVTELIEFVRAQYKNPLSLQDTLQRFGLSEIAKDTASSLSGGQKRRIAVALAFVGQPKIVFLDEPTTGLDIQSRQHIWQVIKDYVAAGGTLFLTTHYLEEAEALATRVLVLKDGAISLQGSVAEIKASAGDKRVRFHCKEFPTEFPGAETISFDGDQVTISTKNTDQLLRDLVLRSVPFKDLHIDDNSLAEAFLNMNEEQA